MDKSHTGFELFSSQFYFWRQYILAYSARKLQVSMRGAISMIFCGRTGCHQLCRRRSVYIEEKNSSAIRKPGYSAQMLTERRPTRSKGSQFTTYHTNTLQFENTPFLGWVRNRYPENWNGCPAAPDLLSSVAPQCLTLLHHRVDQVSSDSSLYQAPLSFRGPQATIDLFGLRERLVSRRSLHVLSLLRVSTSWKLVISAYAVSRVSPPPPSPRSARKGLQLQTLVLSVYSCWYCLSNRINLVSLCGCNVMPQPRAIVVCKG